MRAFEKKVSTTFTLQACTECDGGPFSNCDTVGSDGPGIPNADFVLYVSALNIAPCGDTSSTIAFAATCELEQVLDRSDHHYTHTHNSKFLINIEYVRDFVSSQLKAYTTH